MAAHGSDEETTPFSSQRFEVGEMWEDSAEGTTVDYSRQKSDMPGTQSFQTSLNLDQNGAAKVKDDVNEKVDSVSIFRLFLFADAYDCLLLLVGTVGAAVHGRGLPMYVYFFGKLLDRFGANRKDPSKMAEIVSQNALNLLYTGLVLWVASWAEVAAYMQTGERQAARIRVRFLEAILKQDVSYFDTDACIGEVLDSISADTLHIQDAIGEKMGNCIHYTTTFISGFAVAFSAVPKLSLFTLAVLPPIALTGGVYAAALTGLTSKSQKAYAEAGRIAEQTIAQIRTVYSFVGEQKAAESYSNCLEQTLKLGHQGSLTKGLGMGVSYFLVFSCWGLLFWYAGVLVRKGEANGGECMSTIIVVTVGALALGHAMLNVPVFARAQASAFRLFTLMGRKPANEFQTSTFTERESTNGHIEFKNVEFNYPYRPDAPILRSFSLDIPATKTVAIVGSSGAGKSTVVSLIERFYDPDHGEVLLDGVNIKNLSLKWLRGQIGLVSQEPALFATSIKENILYGKPDATEDEIEEACKSANAHDFISGFLERYNTQVGERSVHMSGGQKQRIAIARAILKNPRILLLDEATSAVDASSERLVQEELDKVMVGRTTVSVAHRLSTVRNADIIAVVQDGSIVETGDHDSLLERRGAYSSLFQILEVAQPSDMGHVLSRESSSRFSQSIRRSVLKPGSLPSPILCEKSSKKRTKNRVTLWRVLKLNLPEWGYGVFGVLGSIFSGLTHPLFGLIMCDVLFLYYETDQKKMSKHITKNTLVLVGIGGGVLLSFTAQHACFGVVGENLPKRVRELMFVSILKNEVSWFDRDENNSSQVCSRLSADATTVKGAVGDRMSMIIGSSSCMLATIAIAFTFQWKMACVVLATFPLQLFGAICERIIMKGFSKDVALAHARSSMVAGEAVINIRTVAAFNAEDRVVGYFQRELAMPLKRCFWLGQVAGFGYGLSQAGLFGSNALSLWYGSLLLRRGEAGFDQVIKTFLVLIISAVSIADTLAMTPDLDKGDQTLESVFSLLDRRTKIDANDPDAEVFVTVRGDIKFEHVSFTYPVRPDVQIFRDLNLQLRAGKSLALVGPSGSGKSSVIALLERFYDPTSGSVCIDGKDIKNVNLNSLRRRIALVSQEPALFATTIFANILLGCDNASDQEIYAAAEMANAHNFISALPAGYNTQVGEGGIQLSGGQKQRVATARAVLKNPAILLLDEATSALDAESEMIVQESLDRLMRGRTTVLVAHRLSTIRKADSIVVMHDGQVMEEGTHDNLVAKPHGAYTRLVYLQSHSL